MPSRNVWLTIKAEFEKVIEYKVFSQGNSDTLFYTILSRMCNEGDAAVRESAKFSELLRDLGDTSGSDPFDETQQVCLLC